MPPEVLAQTFPSASPRMELMNLLGKPSRSVYLVATPFSSRKRPPFKVPIHKTPEAALV